MNTRLLALIGLAALGFLLAVFVVVLWPFYGMTAEAFSRASNNLALIAIALALAGRSKGS